MLPGAGVEGRSPVECPPTDRTWDLRGLGTARAGHGGWSTAGGEEGEAGLDVSGRSQRVSSYDILVWVATCQLEHPSDYNFQ